MDFDDVSLVDGFNIPVSITAQGGTLGCSTTSRPANVNSVCPPELALKGKDGNVVACRGSCLALGMPQYCCAGSFGSPQTCPPTSYSKIFRNQCPQAYGYAYDDRPSTFTCVSASGYRITFCP